MSSSLDSKICDLVKLTAEVTSKGINSAVSQKVPQHGELDKLLGQVSDLSPKLALAVVLLGISGGFYQQIQTLNAAGEDHPLDQSTAHSIVDLWGKRLACEALLATLIADHRANRKDSYFGAQTAALLASMETLLIEQLGHLARFSALHRSAPAFDWAFTNLCGVSPNSSKTDTSEPILSYLYES